MSKRINVSSKFFLPSGSHTILVFPYQTGWRYSDGKPLPNGGVECRWGRQKTRFRTNIWLYWTCVYWCLQHIYRVTLNRVFLGHFRTNLHETRTQILMRDRNTGTQPNFQKKTLSKCGILSPKNSCSHFSSCVSSKFVAVTKINKWRYPHFGHALSWT